MATNLNIPPVYWNPKAPWPFAVKPGEIYRRWGLCTPVATHIFPGDVVRDGELFIVTRQPREMALREVQGIPPLGTIVRSQKLVWRGEQGREHMWQQFFDGVRLIPIPWRYLSFYPGNPR